jgi:hypothetical protein
MKRTIDLSEPLSALFVSSVFSEIRGSVGGSTYSRVRGGAIVRNRTKPINPNTPNQALVRSRVATLAEAFGMLTPEQITAWTQFAQTYPMKNAIGEEYIPTGKQLFFLCNLNLMSIGVATIAVPPYETAVTPGVDIESAVLTAELASSPEPLTALTVAGITTDYTGGVFIMQMSPPLQASRSGFRNKYRQIGYDETLATLSIALLADWNTYFGNPVATQGQIIKARVAVVAPDSGISSSWFELSPATITVEE